MKSNLVLYLKGLAMGAADIVPGVSGGTIALITGIYEELISSIKNINTQLMKTLFKKGIRQFWKDLNGTFLIILVTGIFTSVILLARVIVFLLENHEYKIWGFFFGLIIASAFVILKDIIARRTPEDETSIRLHDEHSFYAIEQYCKENGLEFHYDEMKQIVDQARPTIKYFKNTFDVPRPHEVDRSIRPMSSVTNKTRSYPSGHATQSMLIALYVSEKFPKHEKGIKEAAKESGLGRVKAGLHYLADYVAGNLLAEKMFMIMNRENYGKYVNEDFTQKDVNDLEKFADRILRKYGIDVEFTRHFVDRLNDPRNSPDIKVSELQRFFKKIQKNKGRNIINNPDVEAVLKDMATNLNLPVVIKTKSDDSFEVTNKTIMRKKDFKTTSKVINYA